LLIAIARDPLLAASADAIVSLPPNAEYNRDALHEALRRVVGERLNDDTMDKVVRNVASSWTQSGHLIGRTLKRRAQVSATPAAVALALYLGHAAGFRGDALFTSGWLQVLDCTPSAARDLALEAKRQGLIDLRAAGGIVVLDVERLDPYAAMR
jgi:Arc/MetJ family transcription regulator